MRRNIPIGYLFSVAFVAGILIGYWPAAQYFKIGQSQIAKDGTFVDTSFTVLHGVITGVDREAKKVYLRAVSPYSPLESAPFGIAYADNTLVRAAPLNPEFPKAFLPSLEAKTVDTSHLAAGTPVTIRVSRVTGTLRASWIAVPSPLN